MPILVTSTLLLWSLPTGLAATSGTANMELSVQDKAPEILRIDVTEASGTANDGFILAGTTSAAVTYKVVEFDRNGEVDLRDDASLTVSVYGPGANGAKQTMDLLVQNTDHANLAVPTAVGGECEGLAFTDTPASPQAAATGDLAIGASKLTDNAQTNGVLDCQFSLTFNDAGLASTAGEYTIRVDPGAGGTVREIVTVVYETMDTLIQVVDAAGTVQAAGAKVGFGDGAAQNLNAQPASGNRLKILQNAQAEFKVDLTFTDLACTTGCPPDSSGQVKTIAKTSVGYKEAFNANPVVVPGDANVPAGGTITSTNVARDSGDNIRFAFMLDDLTTQGQGNELLKDGTYTGTITVTVRGDTSEGAYYYNGAAYDPVAPATPRSLNPGAATVAAADGLGTVTIGAV